MSPIVHIIGAGVAGLAAAYEAARTGRNVRLYEAAGHAGGRCAALPGGDDNGTHVILGANRVALTFLKDIGAASRWIEPEAEGLPLVDLVRGQSQKVSLAPARWWANPPPGFGLAALGRLLRIATLLRDRPVAAIAGGDDFSRAVLTPLTLAALNTPMADASARRLGIILRRLLASGAGRLFVANRGLGPDLIEPALQALNVLGVRPRFHHRLRRLVPGSQGVARLEFGTHAVDIAPTDLAILAIPAYAAGRLLPGLRPPDLFEPIVNAHFATDYAGPVRFIGLIGGTAQWVLLRPGSASVTISAARAEVVWSAEQVFATVAPEVIRAAGTLGLSLASLQPRQLVKERRATPSHPPGRMLRVPPRPLANLILAGDWLSPLPATIEAAVASGRAAASLAGAGPSRVERTSPAALSA